MDEKQFSFQGKAAFTAQRTLNCAAYIGYQQWNPKELTVDLLWLGDDDAKRDAALALRYLATNHLWIQSLDGYHLPVELLGISGVSTQSFGPSVHSSKIDVSAVQIVITKEKLNDDKDLTVTVRLQPSGILCLPSIHSQLFTGEVKINAVETGVVEFYVEAGKLEARETYEYNNHEQHGDRVTDRIQRATMLGTIKVEKDQTLWDAHEKLKDEIWIACSALSLCYRQHIDFYEIEYLELNDDSSIQSIFRRKWPSSKKRLPGDELINTRSLINGGLQKLINGIESLDRSKDIHRAIRFLSNSYEETAEIAYFMAFSAMETIVSCCLENTEEYIAGSSKWKKIERTLKQAIKTELEEEFHDPLIGKLAELKRLALSTRIELARNKFHPKTEDLWPTISFEDGIARAANIRNGLFHSANIEQESTLVSDLIRIRHFTERLLLKLVGWADEDIWIWHDQQLKWVNSNER